MFCIYHHVDLSLSLYLSQRNIYDTTNSQDSHLARALWRHYIVLHKLASRSHCWRQQLPAIVQPLLLFKSWDGEGASVKGKFSPPKEFHSIIISHQDPQWFVPSQRKHITYAVHAGELKIVPFIFIQFSAFQALLWYYWYDQFFTLVTCLIWYLQFFFLFFFFLFFY